MTIGANALVCPLVRRGCLEAGAGYDCWWGLDDEARQAYCWPRDGRLYVSGRLIDKKKIPLEVAQGERSGDLLASSRQAKRFDEVAA